jgi:hypothetical protein
LILHSSFELRVFPMPLRHSMTTRVYIDRQERVSPTPSCPSYPFCCGLLPFVPHTPRTKKSLPNRKK